MMVPCVCVCVKILFSWFLLLNQFQVTWKVMSRSISPLKVLLNGSSFHNFKDERIFQREVPEEMARSSQWNTEGFPG